jgi:integrase/recombinase XerD
MSTELVKASSVDVLAPGVSQELPSLVELAGGAACFAWDEFFYAEHHNPHTQKAYMRAVKAFLSWCEGQGLALLTITPGTVSQYLGGLGDSATKRNLHLSAIRGFFDRLVNRHVCTFNPAASVRGVKDQVIEGKTPEITVEHARTLLASIDTGHVVGLPDRAILGTLAYTACRAGRWPGRGSTISSMMGSNSGSDTVNEEDIARLSPARYEHINPYGKYCFEVEEGLSRSHLRPLCQPTEQKPR